MSASNDQTAQAAIALDSGAKLNDEIVREYLKTNDDFLQRHPDMLDYLHVSHASGSAVSLVEKQASVMRERNTEMRHRLNTLTTNAQDNDQLFEQTSALVLRLLDADSVAAIYKIFINVMARDFGVEHASMILYSESTDGEGYRVETRERAQREIGSLFRGHKAVAGTLRKEELRFLFPEGGEVGSAALVPLSNSEQLGLIAVGSSNANRYHSDVGTLFLSHIADVIVRLLPRLQKRAD